jgi:hypothetical protein
MLRAFLNNRVTWALAGVVVLAALLPVGLRNSDAAFVAGTTNDNSLFSSASSFNTVFTTLSDPGSPLRGTVTLNAVASSDRGMGSVQFQTSPAGANTWTTRCTDNAPAYSCALDTTTLTDGLYDIRALATDSAGYSNSSAVANRRVDNTAPTAVTTNPGTPLTGTVSVTGTGADGGSGVASTTVQYRPNGGGSWTDICTQAGASATCAWSTASLADGLYDLRTVVADAAGNTGTSAVVTARRLDNVAPTATLTDPGSPLAGTVTLASTSADAANGTGVASVRYEYRLGTSGPWSTACTSATAPFSCSFDTTTVPADGLYELRAVAVDGVGKEGASAGIAARRIDNTAPAATMGALAAALSGSVSLTSTITEGGSGLASVQYQYKLVSDSTWSNACAPATSPWTCSFNTATLTDGLYDFRVVATDAAGNTGTSTPVFSRRVDNTNPTVTMGSLAAWIDGTVTLTSTPLDGGGIASVQYQYKASSSGTWLNTCGPTTSPYTCAFNTTAFISGSSYDFRAIATDNAGRTGTSAPITSRIDHTPPAVTMTAPAANIGGSVTLASTPTDAHSGVASVQYEYRVATTGAWTSACSSASTPWTCAFDTSGLADGFYDFRVTATDNVGRSTTSATVANRRVDNTDPGVPTLNAVGTPLSGSVTFGGTATDGGSGIATWAVQYAPAGTTTWTTLCSDNATPYGCTASVAGIPDGLYDFRALATDNAGNTRASTVQANRRIDTAGPVASITSPANNARVHDTITMVASASDPAGVAWVRFEVQIAPGFWYPICTDNTASYTCQGDTTQVADGTYQIRVVARDTLGNETTSALTTLIVDNTHPSATAIDSASDGATDGRIDAGDAITFTWSEPMAPASIMSGWTGAGQAVRVLVDNNSGNDEILVYDAAGATRLELTSNYGLRLNADYVSGDVWLNGTMTMSGNSVTVTIGSVISGGASLRSNVTGTPEMQWNSSDNATDLAGNTAQGNQVTEPLNDRDF